MTTPNPTDYAPAEPGSLLDILTKFPSARVTVTFNNRPCKYRPKPRQWDEKVTKKHGVQIRMQRKAYSGRHFIGYETRRGRPVFQWVRECNLSEDEKQTLAFVRRQKAASRLL